jgi:peptidoglycan/xylan/chitin deacetylase (PgdA/CDA1 family)
LVFLFRLIISLINLLKKYYFLIIVVLLLSLSACEARDVSKANIIEGELKVERVMVSEVPIVMYHYVREVDRSTDPLGWNLSINPVDFEKQLAYLKNEGYLSLKLQDLLEGEVPEKSIVLSFDDGLEDFYSTALPLLKEYGFTATNAIITDMIGERGHMTKEQIEECLDAGIEITSHTVSHPNLTNLSTEDLRSELLESKNYLIKEFGISVDSFVYPSGKYDDEVLESLLEVGYLMALTTNYGVADLSVNLLELPRIRVDNRDGFEGFVEKMKL